MLADTDKDIPVELAVAEDIDEVGDPGEDIRKAPTCELSDATKIGPTPFLR